MDLHQRYIVLFLVAAIALYGFKTALGGRRVVEFTDAQLRRRQEQLR